jgi:hypothetical protein
VGDASVPVEDHDSRLDLFDGVEGAATPHLLSPLRYHEALRSVL